MSAHTHCKCGRQLDSLDGEGRLHNPHSEGFAIRYPDGFGLKAIHGKVIR